MTPPRKLPAAVPALAAVGLLCFAPQARAADVTIDPSSRHQVIDGFGTCLSGDEGGQDWFQQLYFDELRSSMLRVDLTPPFVSPYSDHVYNSPWFGNTPSIDGGGPEGNYVRSYTDAADYTRLFGGQRAEIAVMGPDIDANVALFDYSRVAVQGAMARAGLARKASLGDFKLYGSLWSPAPWLKLSSGNQWPGADPPLPPAGTSWPFVWGGNFAGGLLDTSNTPRAEFDDSALGGTGPTSALTQFARSLAAYLRGFQNAYGVRFHAISIQNELNFEEFYNSCSYPLASQYLAALKAARAELDRYDDLREIRIAGPEDLLGGDAYGLWQYGGGNDVTHKNLQYLREIAADPAATAAISLFAIHGYDADGASAAGADPQSWAWWANGWSASPAAGIPGDVAGFTAAGKPSWMTETSGEDPAWLAPAGGFPGQGAFSIAIKLHQALTTGRESAWLYWQLTDGRDVAAETLTDASALATSPKLVAAKHFFRHIRPGAVVVEATVAASPSLLASAYLHEAAGTLTVVLINPSPDAESATVALPAAPAGLDAFDAYSSSDGSLWVASRLASDGGHVTVPVPGYGVVTLVGEGQGTGGAGGSGSGGAGGSGSGGAGGSGGGGGAAGAGGRAGGGAGSDGSAAADGGCGCSSGGLPGVATAFALALALALGVSRGQRRRSG